jgi:glutamine cyclotransferase
VAAVVDGIGSESRLQGPWGLAANGHKLWFTDYGAATVRSLEPVTKTVAALAGAAGVVGSTDGAFADARFTNPGEMTYVGKALYMSASYSHTIRKLDLLTGQVTTFAGGPNQAGFADGTGTAARFNDPHGITNDGTYLYVTDYKNSAIRRVEIATGKVFTLAGGTEVGGSPGTYTTTMGHGPSG